MSNVKSKVDQVEEEEEQQIRKTGKGDRVMQTVKHNGYFFVICDINPFWW